MTTLEMKERKRKNKRRTEMNKYHVKFTHQYIRPQGSTVDTSSAIQYITETVDAEWELNDWVNVFTYIYAHYEVIGCVEVTHINAIKELENDENGGIVE